MNPVAKELFETGDRYLTERPADIESMRKRMGTRGQNMTVQLYAFSALSSSTDMMYMLQEAVSSDEYEFETLKKIALDWLATLAPPSEGDGGPAIIGHRASVHFHLHELAEVTSSASTEVAKSSSREELKTLLQGLEHYYNQVRTWIDLEFPWHELAVRYAELMGDPPVRPAP